MGLLESTETPSEDTSPVHAKETEGAMCGWWPSGKSAVQEGFQEPGTFRSKCCFKCVRKKAAEKI